MGSATAGSTGAGAEVMGAAAGAGIIGSRSGKGAAAASDFEAVAGTEAEVARAPDCAKSTSAGTFWDGLPPFGRPASCSRKLSSSVFSSASCLWCSAWRILNSCCNATRRVGRPRTRQAATTAISKAKTEKSMWEGGSYVPGWGNTPALFARPKVVSAEDGFRGPESGEELNESAGRMRPVGVLPGNFAWSCCFGHEASPHDEWGHCFRFVFCRDRCPSAMRRLHPAP